MKGKKIKTFNSNVEAHIATGVFATAIGMVVSGGGYIAGCLKQERRETTASQI